MTQKSDKIKDSKTLEMSNRWKELYLIGLRGEEITRILMKEFYYKNKVSIYYKIKPSTLKKDVERMISKIKEQSMYIFCTEN